MEIENLIKLIDAVSKSELTGFKYEENSMKLHLTKKQGEMEACQRALQGGGTWIPQDTVDADSAKKENGMKQGHVVESPLVGVFYAAPAEDAQPFACVGDKVTKGQTLGIVEAMKLMNDIESEFDGTVAEIYVENGEAVEYGQPLFLIK